MPVDGQYIVDSFREATGFATTDRRWTSTVIFNRAQDAAALMFTRLEMDEQPITFSLVSGQRFYGSSAYAAASPFAVRQITQLEVRNTAGNFYTLPYKTREEVVEASGGNTDSTGDPPEMWYIEDHSEGNERAPRIGLWPQPNVTRSSGVKIYWKPTRETNVTTFTSTATLGMPDTLGVAVINYCVARGYESIQEVDMSRHFEELYEKQFSQFEDNWFFDSARPADLRVRQFVDVNTNVPR